MELVFKLPLSNLPPLFTPPRRLHLHNRNSNLLSSHSPTPIINYQPPKGGRRKSESFGVCYRYTGSEDGDDEEEDEDENCSVEEAVTLFNQREYYKCHEMLEALWYSAEEPSRTLIHGILQCAVGFHHLFNQNHKGAMMELGEGLCKLRKMNFESGPFLEFEQHIAAVLDFIYNTQIELAACGDDLCVTMEQSEKSYQLLGGYAAGQHLYHLQTDANKVMHIVFCPHTQTSYASAQASLPRVKLPILKAAHLVYE